MVRIQGHPDSETGSKANQAESSLVMVGDFNATAGYCSERLVKWVT